MEIDGIHLGHPFRLRMYFVQYWFHTHGLLRAGVTEIELIIPNRISSYYGIGDLFQTFANNAVENGQVPMNEPIVIAHSQQGSIHTVAVSVCTSIQSLLFK